MEDWLTIVWTIQATRTTQRLHKNIPFKKTSLREEKDLEVFCSRVEGPRWRLQVFAIKLASGVYGNSEGQREKKRPAEQ